MWLKKITKGDKVYYLLCVKDKDNKIEKFIKPELFEALSKFLKVFSN